MGVQFSRTSWVLSGRSFAEAIRCNAYRKCSSAYIFISFMSAPAGQTSFTCDSPAVRAAAEENKRHVNRQNLCTGLLWDLNWNSNRKTSGSLLLTPEDSNPHNMVAAQQRSSAARSGIETHQRKNQSSNVSASLFQLTASRPHALGATAERGNMTVPEQK
ncbi:hypothetical protein OJAV_G00177390 [Oryzias javanicus]|uniref:Uncharacterized protein n=1 Tax=Oryzias javanicus TaxID=123683 RepID=A0A3S2PIV7_ORYJA|nr:hypothetical protein OJAV_G00177390 [Oryzias javanicus]